MALSEAGARNARLLFRFLSTRLRSASAVDLVGEVAFIQSMVRNEHCMNGTPPEKARRRVSLLYLPSIYMSEYVLESF
jgi:hypothetical protein